MSLLKEDSKYTPAQRKAKQKYDKVHYKTLSVKLQTGEFEQIQEYILSQGYTVSMFAKLCIRYCIDNNIDLSCMENTEK